MASGTSVLAVAIRTSVPADTRGRFVDELGQLYARYGMSLTFGRTFGLLLITDDPLSLEQIAAQLGASKTGVSVATRELERLGLARRLGARGSKRVLYEASETMEPLFEAQFARIRESLAVLIRGAAILAPGRAKTRVSEMRELHEFWLHEAGGIMARWRQRRASRREPIS